MRLTYHKDVDLLDIEFSSSPREQTRDVGPHTWGEFDKDERLVGITFQRASEYIDLAELPSGLVEEVEGGSISSEGITGCMKKVG